MLELIQSADAAILLFIQTYIRVPLLNPLVVFISVIGNSGLVWILLSLVLLTPKQYRRVGLTVLVAMGLCYLVNDVLIKHLVARPRPFDTVEGLVPLLRDSATNSYSFPSGHACSSFCAACILTRSLGGRGAWSYVAAALIALSRPYVGVHYLTDVLAGALVGTLGASLIWLWLTRRGLQPKAAG